MTISRRKWGEGLGLAAGDVANKLDRILFERYGDVQMMAKAFTIQHSDYMQAYIEWIKQMYPLYHALWIADDRCHVVATAGPPVEADVSDEPWFQTMQREKTVFYQEAKPSAESPSAFVVSFMAPITAPTGRFRGTVVADIRLRALEVSFVETVRAFERQARTNVEYMFLTRDGTVIVDYLRQLGLPSAQHVMHVMSSSEA